MSKTERYGTAESAMLAVIGVSRFIGRTNLPVRWAVTITEDTSESLPAAFNIWTSSKNAQDICDRIRAEYAVTAEDTHVGMGYMMFELNPYLTVSVCFMD